MKRLLCYVGWHKWKEGRTVNEDVTECACTRCGKHGFKSQQQDISYTEMRVLRAIYFKWTTTDKILRFLHEAYTETKPSYSLHYRLERLRRKGLVERHQEIVKNRYGEKPIHYELTKKGKDHYAARYNYSHHYFEHKIN